MTALGHFDALQPVPAEEDHFSPAKVELNSDWTAEVISRNDPRGFTIGVDTGCCMTLDGVSESCIWAGYSDSRYGFMLFSKNGVVRAQSLMYINPDVDATTLVMDNIEVNQGTPLPEIQDLYRQAITTMAGNGVFPRDTIRHVTVGTGYVDIDVSGLPEVPAPVPTPLTNIYTDSAVQKVLLELP